MTRFPRDARSRLKRIFGWRGGDLELGVAIALGQVGIAQCPRFDARQDGQVTIDELVAAVNVSLYRCAVGPSGYA